MKIITLNLRHNADRWDERFPLVVSALQAEQADMIGLQEVYIPIGQAHRIADALNRYRPDTPYAVYIEPKAGDSPEANEGIGLLTRLPVLEHARLELPGGQRVAQRATVVYAGRTLHIANTHLHHRPVEDESIRLPQMQALLDWMFDYSENGWLLTGDMNALPGSTTITTAAARLPSAYHSIHDSHPHTFPTPLVAANFPDIALTLDYIFYDPQTFQPAAARVVADRAHPNDPTLTPSDHFGVMAEFALRV